jgi:THO complex subunit 4
VFTNGQSRQPKSAARDKAKKQDKPKTNAAAAAAAAAKTNGAATGKNTRNKKSGRAGRPKKKTAEELDAEMVDYFGNDGAPNGTTQQAAAPGGDTGMVDEVL